MGTFRPLYCKLCGEKMSKLHFIQCQKCFALYSHVKGEITECMLCDSKKLEPVEFELEKKKK